MNQKVTLSLLTMLAPAVAMCASEQKPNILWVITDDHRADALACWNLATTGKAESELGYVASPNLDRLASEGVLFTNSFCNNPVSAPSRASMHTGRYSHHSGIYDFSLVHNGSDVAHPLLPNIMREQGYKASLFGKLGVRIFDYTGKQLTFGGARDLYNEEVTMEGDLERSGITDWCKRPSDEVGEMEYWYYPNGTTLSYYFNRKGDLKRTAEDIETMEEFHEAHDIIRIPGQYGKESTQAIISGVSPMPTERTLDANIAREFTNYLDNQDRQYRALNSRQLEGPDSSQPQFINLGFHFPHTAVVPSKEYRDKFASERYNIPAFDNDELSKMPSSMLGWQRHNDITSLTDEEKEQFIRDYYAFSAMGDMLLGRAVDRFKKYCDDLGQPYIIVIACGDHGWHLGEQGVCCKGSNYLKSNQTAVIAISSDKSIFPAGKVVSDFVEYVDFAPTFIAATGVDIDTEEYDYLDGRDLVLTANEQIEPRDYVLGDCTVSGPRGFMRSKDFAFSMASRNPKAPYPFKSDDEARWPLECSPEEAQMALFDLRVDPNEQNNVAYDKEYVKLAAWFREKLGNIVAGDDRVEYDWKDTIDRNNYMMSSFAKGSDDKKLDIPSKLIPKIK